MDDIGSFYDGSASGGGAPLCQTWDNQLSAPVDDFNFDSDMMLPNELLPDNFYATPTKSSTEPPLCSLNNGDMSMSYNHTSGSEIVPVDDDDDDLFSSTDALELIMDQHGKNKEAEMAAAQPQPPQIKKEVVANLQPVSTIIATATNNISTKTVPKIITLQGLSSANKGAPMMIKREPNSSNISIRKITPIQRIGNTGSAMIHKIGAGTPIQVINAAGVATGGGGNVCRINAPQIINISSSQKVSLQQALAGGQQRMITTTSGQNIKLVQNKPIRVAGINQQKITLNTGQKISIAPRMQGQQRMTTSNNILQKVHITQAAGAKINIVRPITTTTQMQQHQVQHRVINPNVVYTTSMNQTSGGGGHMQVHQARNQQPNSVMLISRNNISQPGHRPPTNFIMNNRGTAVMDPRFTNLHNMHPYQQKPMIVTSDPHNLPPSSCLRISLSNVVARLRVCCHLNLRKIATESFDVQYKREKQKVVMRMREPKCTAYMWSSGKIVCTGSTSAANSRRSAIKFVKRLRRIGYEAKFTGYKIVNVLAAAKMPFQIDIQKFSVDNRGPNCSYEPELHCAVSYREVDTGACLKIFSTGSITVTARSVDRAQQAIRNIYPKLKGFYKTDKPLNVCDVFDPVKWNNFQQSSPTTTS